MIDANDVRAVLSPHLADTSRYDIVDVEHEALAPLLPPRRGNRWVITLHNLISQRSHQQAALCPTSRARWLFNADADRAKRLERWITTSYDLTMVMSDTDAKVVGGNVAVVPNGVDTQRFRPTPMPPEPRILFSASFNYHPNVDSAHWFCTQVLPLVQQRVPGATLMLVGRSPDSRVRALASLPGVDAHFDVPAIIPYLEAARVVVVPTRIGTGTRLKALEAMAAARPIVGTTVGLEGLGCEDGVSALIADEPVAFASAIERLCTDDTYAGVLVDGARRLVKERFSWDLVARRYLEVVLDRVLSPDQEAGT
jgi:glycosyltransferase involved in cell wall biosynthesis